MKRYIILIFSIQYLVYYIKRENLFTSILYENCNKNCNMNSFSVKKERKCFVIAFTYVPVR